MSRCEKLWTDLSSNPERPVFKRVDELHPADLYAGLDADDQLELMLLCDSFIPDLPAFESLRVSQNLRQDGRYALVVRLDNSDLKAAFSRVCDDLIEDLRRGLPGRDPGSTLIARLNRWRRLLQPGRNLGLSESELRGLIGELLILEQLIPPNGATTAIRSWVGPDDAPQDFEANGILIEVKACRAGSSSVTISSLEQLCTRSVPVFLVVVYLSPAGDSQAHSFSLQDIVSRVRSTLEPFPTVRDEFDTRLCQAGFNEDWEGNRTRFTCEGIRAFVVDKTFPRVTPATVPPGIIRAIYTIDLSFCGAFERAVPWIKHGTSRLS